MNVLNPKSWGTALGAGLIATVAMLPQAKGELVYENTNGAAAPAAAAAQVDDRSTMRQALGASEKAQVTLQAQAVAPASVPAPTAMPAVQVSAPVSAVDTSLAPASPTVTETENMSKAELIRRERQREELKNEDILQVRLEELRLRDERRRTDEVLGAVATTGAVTAAPAVAAATGAAAPSATATIKEEVVVAPVTDHPGKPALAPAMAAQPNAVSASGVDAGGMQTSMSVAPGPEGVADHSDHMMMSISPRAGLSNMVDNSGFFQISPHFSGGISAAMGAGDYVSIQAGYTYSQYGVSMASSNPFVLFAQQQAAMTGQSNFQSLNMNQNVFDAGVKVHLLGPDSRIRPFIGGGGAYAQSYINFSSQILQQMNTYYPGGQMSPDYKVNNFLGYLSTGADFKVSKNISVGAEFRYYAVFSDSESSALTPYYGAFYGGYGGGYGSGVNSMNQDTAVAGGSLARNSFYSIMGNVTFTF